MNIRPVHIFALLTISFLVYSFTIYLTPLTTGKVDVPADQQALEGRLVWQKYNCQSCHQLYGLGGYLGPDLTNVYSAEGKGEVVIRAMVKSGVKQMPAFDLSESEMKKLLAFLRTVDASGHSDPRRFRTEMTGMINESR